MPKGLCIGNIFCLRLRNRMDYEVLELIVTKNTYCSAICKFNICLRLTCKRPRTHWFGQVRPWFRCDSSSWRCCRTNNSVACGDQSHQSPLRPNVFRLLFSAIKNRELNSLVLLHGSSAAVRQIVFCGPRSRLCIIYMYYKKCTIIRLSGTQ